MKRFKRMTAALLAAGMLCVNGLPENIAENLLSVQPVTVQAEDPLTYGILTYEVNEEGTITITDCDESATEVVIPSEIDGIPVTTIGVYAFYYCEDLASVTIPDSVKTIKRFAFGFCTSLTSVTIPEGVTELGDEVFHSCENLTTVSIPGSVSSIGGDVFYNTPWLAQKRAEDPLVIINNVLVDGQTFQGYMAIPDTVTMIANNSCEHNASLTDVEIPDTVTYIGRAAFYDCPSLTSIVIPDSVTEMGTTVFSDCTSLINVSIGSGITTIESSAFSVCKSLTDITIPETVTCIDLYAFTNCTSLQSITVENPDCVINGDGYTISNGNGTYNGIIYGYAGSPAQTYAGRYGYTFAALDEEDPVQTTTEQTTTTAVTTTTTTETSATTSTSKATTTTTTTTTTEATTTTTITTTTVTTTTESSPSTETKTFTNGADNWSFHNSRNNFGNSYYMNDTYWNTLMNGLSNSEKTTLKKYVRDAYWQGSCYGMATTSILASQKILRPGDYQSGANFLYDIANPPTDEVKSLINYYFAIQFTDVIQQRVARNFYSDDERAKLQSLLDCLEDGSPTLLCFHGYFYGESWGGHAVVAYDVEYGTYSYNGKAYNGKIVIYDNNSVDYDDDFCLYFNSSSGNWIIPYYELDSTQGSVLGLITDEMQYINYHGYLNGTASTVTEDYIATLRSAAMTSNYKLIKASYMNGMWTNSTSSDDDIKVFSALADTDFANCDIMFAMKDAASGYIMKTEQASPLELTMSYENSLMNAITSAGTAVKFSPDGCVELEGEDMEYQIDVVLDEGYMVTDWYSFSVSGDGADTVTLKKAENGYILTASDLSAVTAGAYNDDVTANVSFSTEYTEVFLYEIDENTIGVSADTDGDGTYETPVAGGTASVLGDLNSDGEVNAGDAAMILVAAAAVGSGSDSGLTAAQENAADLNQDDAFDAVDAALVLQYAAYVGAGGTQTLEEFLSA